MDSTYCILLAIGLHLEVWCESGAAAQQDKYLFGTSVNPERTKSFIANTLKAIWDADEFIRHAEGPVGTHSLRKFPSTLLRENVIVNMLQQGPRFLDHAVAMALALPILWICFEEDTTIGLPPERMQTQIRETYENIRQLEPGVNRVQRDLMVVSGFENEVRIDEIYAVGNENEIADAEMLYMVLAVELEEGWNTFVLYMD